jgi:hypothetical protein
MSEHRHIPEPGETIRSPSTSWAPFFFAIGAVGAVVGIFANGFVFSAFIWSYIGIVILLFAFRASVKSSTRSYRSLPRRQVGAHSSLPLEQIHLDSRPNTRA